VPIGTPVAVIGDGSGQVVEGSAPADRLETTAPENVQVVEVPRSGSLETTAPDEPQVVEGSASPTLEKVQVVEGSRSDRLETTAAKTTPLVDVKPRVSPLARKI